jgi:hypothetical protein
MKWIISICLLGVVLTLCVLAVLHATRVESEAAMQRVVDSVRSLLQITPQVTMRSTVWPQKSQGVLELATISQQLPVEYTFEHTFLGSTKHLKLRGQFTVKAGFDLREAFSVTISGNGRVAQADFPSPKILSVQLEKYEVAEDTSGWWNYLNQADQQETVAAMTAEARHAAEQAGILTEARASLTKQLQALGDARGQQWKVRFRGTPPAQELPENNAAVGAP